jgi:hypothetical protein
MNAVSDVGSHRDDDNQQDDEPPLQGFFSAFISSPRAGTSRDGNPSSEHAGVGRGGASTPPTDLGPVPAPSDKSEALRTTYDYYPELVATPIGGLTGRAATAPSGRSTGNTMILGSCRNGRPEIVRKNIWPPA